MKSLSSNNPIGFELEGKGVWAKLEQFFKDLPAGATVYWVTFSLSSVDVILDSLQELQSQSKFKLRVICRNPLSKNGPSLSKAAFVKIQKHKGLFVDGKVRAYPVSNDVGLFDEDDSYRPGPLHAKFIVAEKEDGSVYPVFVTGSFNFASNSLNKNTESIFIVEDADQAEKALEAARMLDDLSEDLTEGHCGETKVLGKKAGSIDNAPKDGKSRPVTPVAQPEIISKPEDLKNLAVALDDMLQNYPNPGGCRQYDIYRSLEKNARDGRLKDLLYLPVGVGKTFIALRWLVYHLHNAIENSRNSGAFAVYLTPNEWVETTIVGALKYVAKNAHVDLQQVSKWIRVIRPGGVEELPFRKHVAAVVADECQNWNPKDGMEWKSGRRHTYTNVLNLWRGGNTPILGLSATPCRMQEMKFDPLSFIEKFIGKPLMENEDRPFMQLGEAIDEGFICRPEYEKLLENKRDKVETILKGNNEYDLVGFGEYSQATLRDVWRVLSENPHELARATLKAIKNHKPQRVAIFLPPVEEEADEFIDILRAELRNNGNSRSIEMDNLFDFRSSAASGATGTSVFKEFQNAKKESGSYPPVLVTIDRFQEGVSINDIDMLVMLRATLSPRVAMQALGRGLRLSEGKRKCMVLDAVFFEERVNQWEQSIQSGVAATANMKGPRKKTHRKVNQVKRKTGSKTKSQKKKRARTKNSRKSSGRSNEPTWTKKRINKLTSLYRDPRNLSYNEIASRMDLTRGQVYGKIKRLQEHGMLRRRRRS